MAFSLSVFCVVSIIPMECLEGTQCIFLSLICGLLSNKDSWSYPIVSILEGVPLYLFVSGITYPCLNCCVYRSY